MAEDPYIQRAIQRAKEDPPRLHMKQESKIEERSLEFTRTDDFTVLTREWLVKTIAVEPSKVQRKSSYYLPGK